jgi:putative transposase
MNIVDDCTSECLALEPAFSFGSHDIIRCFESLAFERGLPETVRFDNGPEFTSRAMLQWGADRNAHLHFIEPGKRHAAPMRIGREFRRILYPEPLRSHQDRD